MVDTNTEKEKIEKIRKGKWKVFENLFYKQGLHPFQEDFIRLSMGQLDHDDVKYFVLHRLEYERKYGRAKESVSKDFGPGDDSGSCPI